jgi:hypothetical protein
MLLPFPFLNEVNLPFLNKPDNKNGKFGRQTVMTVCGQIQINLNTMILWLHNGITKINVTLTKINKFTDIGCFI